MTQASWIKKIYISSNPKMSICKYPEEHLQSGPNFEQQNQLFPETSNAMESTSNQCFTHSYSLYKTLITEIYMMLQMKDWLQDTKCDIVRITETWWYESHDWNTVLKGYNLFFKNPRFNNIKNDFIGWRMKTLLKVCRWILKGKGKLTLLWKYILPVV